ncbi:pilus assembly protein PilL [Pseudomonas oryzihabitans]|nr:pilus assembly protein PilL [Pseudomonas psychrotolerans]
MTWKLSTLSPLALAAALAGCATPDTAPPAAGPDSSRNPELLQPDLYPKGAVSEPQVRYGRYTLVNTAPETEQRDLMAQIIDVSIPASMKPSVRDAMQYVVNRSGYTLCGPEQGHVNILYTRPLPAAQYKLGPMSLRNTLQVLAGPAWQVKVDEVMRSVCFVLRPGYQLPDAPRLAELPARTPAPASTTTPAAETATPSAATSTPLLVQSTPAKASTAAAPTIGRATSPRPTTEHHRATPAKDGSSIPRSGAVSVAGTTASPHPAPLVQPAPDHSTPKAIATAQRPATPPPASTTATPYGVPSVRLTEPASAMGETWDAPVGSTLKQSVDAWAKRAGWQVIWEAADLDYPIEAALHFRGTFAEAIAQVFPLYDGARRSFVVDVNSSQRIVAVAERKQP